jgi:hypothetical protein
VPSSSEETGPNGTISLAPVYSIRIQAASSSMCGETRVECDSHADTSVVGKEALIIHDYWRPVSVYSYDKDNGCKEYCTVSAAVAYDHPQTGQAYMLVINQAIEIPHLQNHLVCPMQCRSMTSTLVSFPSSWRKTLMNRLTLCKFLTPLMMIVHCSFLWL